MNIVNSVLEILYPTLCPACGEVTDRSAPWHEKCIRNFWNPRLINSSHTAHLSGCHTLCNYEGAIRDVIIQIKYGGRAERRHVFPQLLRKFPYWDRLEVYDLVIPVPLSKKRLKERGYNQVDLMFEDWFGERGTPYLPSALVKIRNTGVQSLLSREERYENMKGVFHINRGVDVRHHRVLLVDDVYTTGATMEAAAHELITAGAEEVMGLTIASGAY